MSVICALYDKKNKSVWIGSDYLISYGALRFTARSAKWVIAGNWAVGHAGQMRAGNLIEHSWKDIIAEHNDIHAVTAALRQLIIDDGYKSKEEEFQRYGQDMVITDSRNIWSVSSDFSYTEYPDGQLYAEGSGWHLALGAAHALQNLDKNIPARAIVKAAIEAANHYDSNCGRGAWIKEMKYKPAKNKNSAKAAKPTSKRKKAS